MRKAFSILFFVIFLFALPGLIRSFKGADSSVIVAQGAVTLLMLVLAIHFWKPKALKEEKK